MIWNCVLEANILNLYNALYAVSIQQYISTVIKYILSRHITATCFDRKWSSLGQ